MRVDAFPFPAIRLRHSFYLESAEAIKPRLGEPRSTTEGLGGSGAEVERS